MPRIAALAATFSAALILTGATALPAHAVITYNFQSVPQPSQPITGLAPAGNAIAFVGGQASVTYSDGSTRQTSFLNTGNSQTQAATAQLAGAFVIQAFNSGTAPVDRPSMFVTNLHPQLTLVAFQIDGLGPGSGHAAFDRNSTFAGSGDTPGSNAGT